jgi:hypothetical protein
MLIQKLSFFSLSNDWHMPMLNDLQRNEAYMEALQAAVKPDDVS